MANINLSPALLIMAVLLLLPGCADLADTGPAYETWRIQVMHELIADSTPAEGIVLADLGLTAINADQQEIEEHFLELAEKYPSVLPRLVEASAYLPDRRILHQLVDQSRDPCSLRVGPMTMLSHAVSDQDHALVANLLESGCDPNAYEPGDLPPLTTAVMSEDQESVELLLQHGGDPDRSTPNGPSPREIAEINGLEYFNGS